MAEFGADGAGGAGYHDHAPRDPAHDRVHVETNRIPSQKVFEVDVTQLVHGYGSVKQVAEAGYGAETEPGAITRFEDAVHLLAGGRRNRDHQFIGVEFAHNFSEIVHAPCNGNPMNSTPGFLRVVINESNHKVPVTRKFPQEHAAAGSRANNNHPFSSLRIAFAFSPLTPA